LAYLPPQVHVAGGHDDERRTDGGRSVVSSGDCRIGRCGGRCWNRRGNSWPRWALVTLGFRATSAEAKHDEHGQQSHVAKSSPAACPSPVSRPRTI
jgi:hypothetical protein